MTDIPTLIRNDIKEELPNLQKWLREWLESHIVPPRQVRLSIDPEGKQSREFWLVTGEVGNKDSSYRIIYDPESSKYGLECTLNTGVEWYMGPYGTFTKAAEAL